MNIPQECPQLKRYKNTSIVWWRVSFIRGPLRHDQCGTSIMCVFFRQHSPAANVYAFITLAIAFQLIIQFWIHLNKVGMV